MRIADLAESELQQQLLGAGLKVQIGPFTVQMRVDGPPAIYQQVLELYSDYPLAGPDDIADYHIGVFRPRGIRRWLRPQIRFFDDLAVPFEPFPAYMALPAIEWGLNWCIANHANQFLMLHSAVLERYGHALVFPANPGHGKTTLCAALMHRGWRLLSDEFGLVRPLTATVVPLPRLLPLKNESIGVIRAFARNAVLGPTFPKTRKGDVAHLKPTVDSVARGSETAEISLIVFPRWKKGADLAIVPLVRSRAFLSLATNSFNYEVLGEDAFQTVDHLIRRCKCYQLIYSDLDEATVALTELLDGHVQQRMA